MADTRAVLIGMGIVLMIVGFVFSTLVCGVGLLFIILGLVVWQREEDDTAVYTSKSYLQLPGGVPVGAVHSRRRRRALRVAIVACVVLLAALGGYVIYVQLAASHFTGVQVSAPAGDCWSGTVGSGTSSGMNVGGCGSASFDLTCESWLWVDLAKTTTGNWTMSVSGFRGGTSIGTYSVSGNLGAVRGIFGC